MALGEGPRMNRRYEVIRDILCLLLGASLVVGANPAAPTRVDDWDEDGAGPLVMTRHWSFYPSSAKRMFKTPPAVVLDGGRKVLQLKTDHESVGVWRAVEVDVSATRRLVWQWKPLVLPEGGDVRRASKNDQVGRVMLLFDGWKAIVYIWDTTAPVGTEVRPDDLGPVDRVLVVIRSGRSGLGEWHRETRDVYQDYLRIFEEEPRRLKWVGLESHSDDVEGESAVLFGEIQFDKR